MLPVWNSNFASQTEGNPLFLILPYKYICSRSQHPETVIDCNSSQVYGLTNNSYPLDFFFKKLKKLKAGAKKRKK